MDPIVSINEIGHLCQRQVVSIDQGQDIVAAARLMREKHVGCLIVTAPRPDCDAPGVVGVLTDRDIVVSVIARGAEPQMLKVGDVMTRNPLLAGEESSLDATLAFMGAAGVRRVPVLGKQGELVGVLSLDDVLARMARQLDDIVGSMRAEQQTEGLLRP